MGRKQKPRRPFGGRGGTEIINCGALERLSAERGLLMWQVFTQARLAPHTAERISRGEEVRPSTVEKIASVLGLEELAPLVVAPKKRQVQSDELVNPTRDASTRELAEWKVEQVLTPWKTASNGLQYRVSLLSHRFLPDTYGRGKCYELGHLATKERERIAEHLLRHPKICRKLPECPQIPVNERTFPDSSGNAWWVIDRWVPGKTLAEVLEAGPLAGALLRKVMREIAEGLSALHQAKIIRRELSPRFVWLCESDNSVLLTDFELGKLFDGSPTVSDNEWPDDPYRAPEVGSETIDVRADLYSWARIVVHGATGALPARGAEAMSLASAGLPKVVSDITRRSVALPRSERPNSIDEVLAALRRWK